MDVGSAVGSFNSTRRAKPSRVPNESQPRSEGPAICFEDGDSLTGTEIGAEGVTGLLEHVGPLHGLCELWTGCFASGVEVEFTM